VNGEKAFSNCFLAKERQRANFQLPREVVESAVSGFRAWKPARVGEKILRRSSSVFSSLELASIGPSVPRLTLNFCTQRVAPAEKSFDKLVG
jgi:hypothetical protein